MLEKIKTYYKDHSMYVNIAIVGLLVFGLYKAFKK